MTDRATPHPFTVLAALALAASTLGAAPSPPTAEAFQSAASRYLEPYLETGNFSGAILVARQGRILLRAGYGLANVELGVPNAPDTVFHLASVSRVFTSAAILLLEQRGKLALTDTLDRHLPGWPHGERITIQNLLTLSAGFPNINDMAGYAEWSRSVQTPASLAAHFRDLPLEFEPGSRSVHSNSNYTVLALLVERISGLPFGDFLEREIFGPLGMTHSGHDGDSARIIPGRAAGYAPTGLADLANAPTLEWSVKTGNGSLYSTVGDLYRFDRALVAGELLGAEAVRATFTDQLDENGYGWFVRRRLGATEVYINGRSPGFGSYLGRLVEPDLTVVVLGNIYNSMPTTIARDLMALALGEEVAPPAFSARPLAPERLAEMVGDYQFGPDYYVPNQLVRFRAERGHLFIEERWMMPVAELRFVDRMYGSEVRFERDAAGRITRCLYDRFVGLRVEP